MGLDSGWTNIFHAMTGGGTCCKIGKRIPAIFVYDQSTRIHVCTSINDNGNHYFDKTIPMGEFTNFVIRQALRHDGKYHFSLFINGKLINSVINDKPRVFNDVKVYASNRFYKASNAIIRNFKFESPIAPECKLHAIIIRT